MSLDGNCVDKILLLGGIHRLYNMLNKNLILSPPIFRRLENIHKFFAGK